MSGGPSSATLPPPRTCPRGLRVTYRDREMIRALLHHVRVLTPAQAGEAWWRGSPSGGAQAARRLSILVQAGYLRAVKAEVQPTPVLQRPVLEWQQGRTSGPEGPIDFVDAAKQLRRRWRMSRGRRRTVFVATARAARVFGGHAWADESVDAVAIRWERPRGPGARLWPSEHDVHVTSLYLHLLRCRTSVAERWTLAGDTACTGLEVLGAHATYDAVLLDRNLSGTAVPTLVLRVGDELDAAGLQWLHGACTGSGMAYEVW